MYVLNKFEDEFFASLPIAIGKLSGPVDGRVAKGHGETVKRYQVQIDGSEVACQDEIVSVPSKKQGAPSLRSGQAPRGLPTYVDFVPRDETVAVHRI